MDLHVRMRPRDPAEPHRTATPLELFFDLTFVVAVSQAASGLASGLVGAEPARALIGFLLVFFAIWWAWMNFSWFASAYDTDDVPYRLAVLTQMVGVLILAAGIPRAMDRRDFTVIAAGYVVMRLAMVALRVRAAIADPAGRNGALRYAVGITVAQIGWIGWLFLPASFRVPVFCVLAALELAVPFWAESAGRTSWHPAHIAERYGLFTIIVLGETLLAASVGVQAALDGHSARTLATVVIGGVLTVFSMWWMYFDLPSERIAERVRSAFTDRLSGAFVWGYGHYFVFAGVAATGAGLLVALDQVTHRSGLTRLEAGFTVTVPVSVYLLVVWALHAPYKRPGPMRSFVVPVGVAAILGVSATGQPVLATGLLLVLLVAVGTFTNRARPGMAPVIAPESESVG
jgi:low temperature requirement protein LtrA